MKRFLPFLGVLSFVVLLGIMLRAMTVGAPQETSAPADQPTETETQPTATPTMLLTATRTLTPASTIPPTPTAPTVRPPTRAPVSPTDTSVPVGTTTQPCEGTPMVEQLTVWAEPRFAEEVRLGFINPGEVYPVYGYITGPTPVDQNGYTTQFYQIGYNGGLAWTPADYLQLSGDCSQITRQVSGTEPGATATPAHAGLEDWTLTSTYISGDDCAGAATGVVTVPIQLSFDQNGQPSSLTWYSRVWNLQPAGGEIYYGSAVVEDSELESIVDTINIRLVSPTTLDGDMTRVVTNKSTNLVCQAYYGWHATQP